MRKLYLDIDGVLLTVKNPKSAEFAAEFIHYVTMHFDCFWLTTHCKGNADSAIRYLSNYFDESVISRLKRVKPTNWLTLKTEAIDFSTDFFWLEDYPFQSEMTVLDSNHCQQNLIVVDLNQPDELKRIMLFLRSNK